MSDNENNETLDFVGGLINGSTPIDADKLRAAHLGDFQIALEAVEKYNDSH